MKCLRSDLRRCAFVLIVLCGARTSLAHEGHAALPSTGVTLDGNQLLISPAAIKAIGMKSETIKLGDLQHRLHTNARLELPKSGQAKVSTLTAGKIDRVLVKPGQAVEAGQELAFVESLELVSLQAELLQTAAAIELLERVITQRERLAARGGIAGKVLLENKSELQQTRAQHEIALRKLLALGIDQTTINRVRQSGETIRSVPVLSPISGTIEHVDVRPGQQVESTDHLCDVVDLSRLYLVGEVLESDAYLVAPGQNVVLSFAGRSSFHQVGQVDHVRMKMDERRRMLQAIVLVDNRAGQLRTGMFGRMSIEVAAAQQEIVCPTSALIETENGTVVLRREAEGKFARRPVKIGMRSPERVVVVVGLFPGQQVISRGAHLLAAMFDGIPLPAASAKEADQPRAATAERPRRSTSNSRHIHAARATVELPISQKALATSLIEGRVATIDVSLGQHVQAGDRLGEVESQQLRNLQLELIQSAGKLRWTQSELNRLRPLVDSGNTSAREFGERELEVKTLAQQVSSLQRRLSLIGLGDAAIERLGTGRLSSAPGEPLISGRISIRAPISGNIADIGLTLGQLIHAHDSLFEVQNGDRVWIKAMMLENEAARVQAGQAATVTFPAHPGLRLSGDIVRVAPQLVSRERVLPVWIELPNPDGFLREGMLARVQISLPDPSNTVATQQRARE